MFAQTNLPHSHRSQIPNMKDKYCYVFICTEHFKQCESHYFVCCANQYYHVLFSLDSFVWFCHLKSIHKTQWIGIRKKEKAVQNYVSIELVNHMWEFELKLRDRSVPNRNGHFDWIADRVLFASTIKTKHSHKRIQTFLFSRDCY